MLTKMFKLPASLSSFGIAAVAAATLTAAPVAEAQTARLAFSGGPGGGTFQYFSNGIAINLSRNIDGVEVSNVASAGSVENLRRVNSGDAHFGITYSSDIFLGMNGRLTNDTNRYRDVHVVASLYGNPAHLIVREDSGIKDATDLLDRQIAVGPAGSGSAASAQRFFESLGMWNKIKPSFMGVSQGASALGNRQIDALWVLSDFPNASVIQAAASNRIRLLKVWDASAKGTLAEDHPYYAKVTIPAGTYPGVDYDVQSISDSALWTAGRHLSEDQVYRFVSEIYSEQGLKFMHSVAKAAEAMTIEDAMLGVVTPVHAGAQKFWAEKGLNLSDDQKQ